jgi:hypothetical protein
MVLHEECPATGGPCIAREQIAAVGGFAVRVKLMAHGVRAVLADCIGEQGGECPTSSRKINELPPVVEG